MTTFELDEEMKVEASIPTNYCSPTSYVQPFESRAASVQPLEHISPYVQPLEKIEPTIQRTQEDIPTIPFVQQPTRSVQITHQPQFPVQSDKQQEEPAVQTSQAAQVVQPPVVAYQKGYSTVCKNCGIKSPNLQICIRCKKPTSGGRLIKDPNTSSSALLKVILKKDEVVDLSSDEESEDRITSRSQGLSSTQHNGMEGPEEKPDPEKVIIALSQITTKADGCTMFALFTCSYIRVGSYLMKTRADYPLAATVGELGIYFRLPSCKTGVAKEIGIPQHQILNLHGYFSSNLSYLKITTGPKLASWIRKTLDMDQDATGTHYVCPLNGEGLQKHLVLMFSEHDEHKATVVKHLYKSMLIYDNHTAVLEFSNLRNDVTTPPLHVEPAIVKPTNSRYPATPPPTPAVQAPITDGVSRKLFQYPIADLPANSQFYVDTIITVNNNDIPCLAEEQFLNDQLVALWMRHIVEQLSSEDKDRTYVYNTFFYKRLTTKPKPKRKSSTPWEYDPALSPSQKRHLRVKGWTKKVDIFKKDFLFIPINENAHWFLVVICFPGLTRPRPDQIEKVGNGKSAASGKACENGNENVLTLPEDRSGRTEAADYDEPMDTDQPNAPPEQLAPSRISSISGISSTSHARVNLPCILVFDSLGSDNRFKIYSTLREYLQMEYNTRKGSDTKTFDRFTMPGYQPVVPFQPNYCDCGLYVLQYMESFFRSPIKNYKSCKAIKLSNWFPSSAVEGKRKEIYNFILEFVSKNFPENSQYIPELSFSKE